MSENIKLLLTISLIFIFFVNFTTVYATEETTDESEVSSQEENVIIENASDIDSLSVLKPSTGSNVSSINSYEQANLKLNNILCIILIAIGILLILLAIAILIKSA